jgi:GNAT superfamily N-acetyltransferase/predicted nucleic acid-binding protein
MALRFSLDTSCVLNLLNPDEVLDDDLIELLRLAMLNEIALCVTDIYQGEVAGVVSGRRAEVAKRARFLPVVEIPTDRAGERDQLAQAFFGALWPNSTGDTNMADHGRRDCLHLASHLVTGGTAFVTRDGKLREKVAKRLTQQGLVVYSPKEALGASVAARPKPQTFITQSVAVRRATQKDRAVLEELLAPIRDDYPDFEAWFAKKFGDPSTVVNIGVVEGVKASGVAIWKPKDARTAKLSTFYVSEDARSLGLGQHLLFHCLRQWIEQRIERAYVTAGADKNDIIRFCVSFGFRIEGAAQRRYSKGGTELVLAKHFVYRSVSEVELGAWLDDIAETVFSVTPPCETAAKANWFVQPQVERRRAVWNPDTRATALLGREPDDRIDLTVPDLESLFYPVRLALGGRTAYVVPIQKQWADRMMDSRPAKSTQTSLFTFVDKLMLRIDNAYYCSPVYAEDDVVGSPIIFYVSAPKSALAGVAKIIDRVIAEPEDLYLRYSQLGIYKLDDIKKHVAKSGKFEGCAMAMHFGWWVPFQEVIPLKKIIDAEILRGHPQRMQRIDYSAFEAALKLGGLEW